MQTSIITEGFRSLAEGEQVEFFVESGDDGRTKAVQVTGPGGAPPQVRSLPRFQLPVYACLMSLPLRQEGSRLQSKAAHSKGVAMSPACSLDGHLGSDTLSSL